MNNTTVISNRVCPAFFVNEDGLITGFNDTFQQLFARHDLSAHQNIAELLPSDLLPVGDGKQCSGFLDENRMVDISYTPLPGDQGWMGQIYENSILNQWQSHLVAAAEQAPNSIVITDTTGAIQFVNRHFCEISGYTKAELIGKNPRVLKSGNTPETVYADLWESITAGKVWQGQFENRSKEGRHYLERASIFPLADESGTIKYYLAIKVDITRKRELEGLAIEISEQELRRIGVELHDDISQLLTGISFKMEALNSQLEPDAGDVRELARDINLSIREAIGKTRRIISGVSPVNLEQGRLHRSISSLLSRFSEEYPFESTLQIDPSLSLSSNQMIHVYRIIQEAVIFAVVRREARSIDIQIEQDSSCKTISITDDGITPDATPEEIEFLIIQARSEVMNAALQITREPDEKNSLRIRCK
jgi:two-component system sensor histidine kinase NreB